MAQYGGVGGESRLVLLTITLHSLTLHSLTLHSLTLRSMTLPSMTLSSLTLHPLTLHPLILHSHSPPLCPLPPKGQAGPHAPRYRAGSTNLNLPGLAGCAHCPIIVHSLSNHSPLVFHSFSTCSLVLHSFSSPLVLHSFSTCLQCSPLILQLVLHALSTQFFTCSPLLSTCYSLVLQPILRLLSTCLTHSPFVLSPCSPPKFHMFSAHLAYIFS